MLEMKENRANKQKSTNIQITTPDGYTRMEWEWGGETKLDVL